MEDQKTQLSPGKEAIATSPRNPLRWMDRSIQREHSLQVWKIFLESETILTNPSELCAVCGISVTSSYGTIQNSAELEL
jgi:hypothetical protein